MGGEKKKSEKISMEPIKATAPLDKIIPKYCTNVNFAVTNDKQFVITFAFQGQDQEFVVIDRVAVSYDHAKNLSKVLNDLLEKVEKDGSSNSNKATAK